MSIFSPWSCGSQTNNHSAMHQVCVSQTLEEGGYCFVVIQTKEESTAMVRKIFPARSVQAGNTFEMTFGSQFKHIELSRKFSLNFSPWSCGSQTNNHAALHQVCVSQTLEEEAKGHNRK